MTLLQLLLAMTAAAAPPDDATVPGTPPAVAGPVGQHGIIGAEDRKLLAEFVVPGAADQAAARAGLGATHRLSCGASASLVHRNDTIIFSAHQLLDHGKPDPDVAHCFFEVPRVVNGKLTIERYPLLLDTLDQGKVAPASGDEDDAWNADNQRDWAIVRLARPVPGIVPYRLPDAAPVLEPGTGVTTVSETTENWTGSSKPNDRLAQSCHVVPLEATLAQRFPAVTHLDCDIGPGASGGALLEEAASGHPLYVGTTIAYTGNECTTTKLDYCFSIARRLDDDLIARIKGTTALRATPQDKALGAAQDARLAADRDAVAAAAAAALAAPFPARDDLPGRAVVALLARIDAMVAAGHAADADALFLEAFHTLQDPGQTRPEWTRLFVENGDSMRVQKRTVDAFQCYRSALAVAPEPLKPYLRLRMALSNPDAAERATELREAYLAGGAGLFRTAGAEAALAEIEAHGVPTTPDD